MPNPTTPDNKDNKSEDKNPTPKESTPESGEKEGRELISQIKEKVNKLESHNDDFGQIIEEMSQLLKGVQSKAKQPETNKTQQKAPEPSALSTPVVKPNAPVVQPSRPSQEQYSFITALTAFANEQPKDAWKNQLIDDLINKPIDFQKSNSIKTLLETYKSKSGYSFTRYFQAPDKFDKLKTNLITLITSDDGASSSMKDKRMKEKDATTPTTYASFILGLGRTTSDFKATQHLQVLDKALGVTPSGLNSLIALLPRAGK